MFNTEVRSFSLYDCLRSIPSAIDGLKPSQRKIVYGMMKKFSRGEVKVSIASAGIMEITSYHHGSLDGTMVGLAQDFPGSNNVPLLMGNGQFGNRLSPNAAASRYIFVELSKSAKKIFNTADDPILNYLEDDGDIIEPDYYLPIIPMVLVNGAEGMGTGFACSVLQYNPDDLKAQCLNAAMGKQVKKLVPWFNGFRGTVAKDDAQTVVAGKIVVKDCLIQVVELPVGTFAMNYRQTLNDLEDKGIIRSYEDNSNDEGISFTIKCSREFSSLPESELLTKLKLVTRSSENLTLWGDSGKLIKFESPEALVQWFVEIRVQKMELRRQNIIAQLQARIPVLEERARFIQFYQKNTKKILAMSKKELEELLRAEGFVEIPSLIATKIYELTSDQVQAFMDEVVSVQQQLVDVMTTSAREMYINELKAMKL